MHAQPDEKDKNKNKDLFVPLPPMDLFDGKAMDEP
jgi:hypothetical protein